MSYWRKSALCLLPYVTVLCFVAAGCTTAVQREEADMKAATADELTALLQQRERAVET
jgi:uncharacterized protein YpmS